MSLAARLARVEWLCTRSCACGPEGRVVLATSDAPADATPCPTCAVVPAIIFSADGAPTTCPQCGRQVQEFTIDVRDREAPL